MDNYRYNNTTADFLKPRTSKKTAPRPAGLGAFGLGNLAWRKE